MFYLILKTAWSHLHSSRQNTGTWRTDRQTTRDHYCGLHCEQCGRAVKRKKIYTRRLKMSLRAAVSVKQNAPSTDAKSACNCQPNTEQLWQHVPRGIKRPVTQTTRVHNTTHVTVSDDSNLRAAGLAWGANSSCHLSDRYGSWRSVGLRAPERRNLRDDSFFTDMRNVTTINTRCLNSLRQNAWVLLVLMFFVIGNLPNSVDCPITRDWQRRIRYSFFADQFFKKSFI